jgi:proteic killer suppression protein
MTRFAEKQLRKLPKHIVAAYYTWVRSVELDGIRATRLLPGYHDEPLKGERKGQRSVRLSKGYRVIYEETESGDIVLIGVLEVNKHEY